MTNDPTVIYGKFPHRELASDEEVAAFTAEGIEDVDAEYERKGFTRALKCRREVFDRLITVVGGVSTLARVLDVEAGAVYVMRHRGVLPRKHLAKLLCLDEVLAEFGGLQKSVGEAYSRMERLADPHTR